MISIVLNVYAVYFAPSNQLAMDGSLNTWGANDMLGMLWSLDAELADGEWRTPLPPLLTRLCDDWFEMVDSFDNLRRLNLKIEVRRQMKNLIDNSPRTRSSTFLCPCVFACSLRVNTSATRLHNSVGSIRWVVRNNNTITS